MFKETVRHLLARQGWFVRKTNGLTAGIDFEDDYLVKACLPAPQIIFDVGAHHGETCERFSRSFPTARILSFEPVAANFAVLAEKTRALPRVECHHLAFGETNDEICIRLQTDSQTHSLLKLADDTTARRETIHVTTLDAFADAHSIPTIDLLKIDTEGYELHVLKGARHLLSRHRIGAILLEASLDPQDTTHTALPSATAFLKPHGYELTALYDQIITRPPVRLAYFNALFVPSFSTA